MTNQQVLERAIQKAIDGGWKPVEGIDTSRLAFTCTEFRVTFSYLLDEDRKQPIIQWSSFGVIFNHDFAKALWGERYTEPGRWEMTLDKHTRAPLQSWKAHLQQMVIADDPIKYLGGNI